MAKASFQSPSTALINNLSDSVKLILDSFRLHVDIKTTPLSFWAKKMAEREGFEPSKRFPVYTLSKRAP